MNSCRGTVFFWIAQALLLPVWICFVATLALRLGAANPILLKAGLYAGLAQIPCTALAILVSLAAGMGELLSRNKLRLLYLQLAVAAVAITLVFLWRAVYRR
jgi:hypothetical protein